MDLEDLKAAIDGYNSATVAALKSASTQIEHLTDRLEDIEARAATPGKTAAGGGSGKAVEHKVFHTPTGPIYELPASTKMADVLPATKAPEISLDRWLAATMAGEKCGDKEALESARDKKQLVPRRRAC